MRILLLLNGPRERYVGGADTARERTWREYCSPGTYLDIGYLPSVEESGGVGKVYAFGTKEALSLGALYPDRCAAAERNGFDAVIIHCFVDPGLRQARERVRIPVVGPGEVTLRAGGSLNRKIGIVTPSSETLDCYDDYVRDLGLQDRIAGIEAIKGPLAPFARQDPRAMTDAVVEAVATLVAQGAEVICPSGLAYIPIRVRAAEVAARVGIPVLDPALLSVKTAEMLVSALGDNGH
ncbi:MAG TPA: aspartate/glutamate racemase family protein [Candidatus Binatia bacterium]